MKFLPLWLLALSLALTGCQNDNLFGGLHREGSGDAVSLLADGQTALATGNYAAALDYFSRSLDQDPNNADALYGAAVAEMGLSGLDIGQLIANALTQNSFAPSLSQAYTGHAAPGAIHVTNNSMLEGIDVDRLDNALGNVIPRLERIRMGLAHGSVPANDTNLLINLGLVRLLRAASRPIRNNKLDVIVNGSDYDILVTTPTDCTYVVTAAKNVAWGYQYLSQAASGLDQSSGDMIFDLKDDVNGLYGVIDNHPDTSGCVMPAASAGALAKPSNPDDGLTP